MSDDPNAAAIVDGATATPPPGDNPLLSGDDAGGDDAGGSPSTWREDWREALAGDDPKALAELKRLGSVDGLYKKMVNQEKLIRTSRSASSLPDDPTPEEIAAYRKSAGIPEAPDGYGLGFPDDLKPTEADTAGMNAWAAFAHERHLPPAAAKAAAEFYTKLISEGREARDEFVRNAEAEARVELRAEWGRGEFKRNITLGYETLEKFMGDDKARDLAGIQLADGRPLGKHPDFMRLLVAAARATADEDALIGGDGAGGGKSIDDEYDELIAENAKKALTGTKAARLEQLADARNKRDMRGQRAA